MLTFCIETVHHTANEFQLVLKAEIDKIGINEDTIRWHEGGVVCEEQRGCYLRAGKMEFVDMRSLTRTAVFERHTFAVQAFPSPLLLSSFVSAGFPFCL